LRHGAEGFGEQNEVWPRDEENPSVRRFREPLPTAVR
jgi:hypothetical protein